jgi:hypothetical protein
MIAGIAVLGTLAGSLSSFFRVGDSSDLAPAAEADNDKASLAALTAEVSALRRQVEALAEQLTSGGGPAG